MRDERFSPDDPREWLNRARSNLAKAQQGSNLPGVYLEDLCFDAQQAAEKAIKAVLIHFDVPFPYVHDLARLLALVEQAGRDVPASVRQAARLTRYAVVTRYPGLSEGVVKEEYDEIAMRYQNSRRVKPMRWVIIACIVVSAVDQGHLGRDECCRRGVLGIPCGLGVSRGSSTGFSKGPNMDYWHR